MASQQSFGSNVLLNSRKIAANAATISRDMHTYRPEQFNDRVFRGQLGLKSNFLGNYRICELLGQGRFGQVFSGKLVTNQQSKEYAIKVIPKTQDDVNRVAYISQEVDHLKAFGSQDGVVGFIEAFEDDHQVYIVQDKVCGKPLDVITKVYCPITEGDAARVLSQIIVPLARLHQHGIVYGDVKPANFMLANQWVPQHCDPEVCAFQDTQQEASPKVVMVDLGCCKELLPWEQHLNQQQGTMPYFAPEVFQSKQSIKSDSWSLGCLFYQLLTGTLPFWGSMDEMTATCDALQDIESFVLEKEVMWDHPKLAYASPECVELLDMLLQKDESQRIHCAEALDHPFIRKYVPDAPTSADLPPRPVKELSTEERREFLHKKRGNSTVALLGGRGRGRGGRRMCREY